MTEITNEAGPLLQRFRTMIRMKIELMTDDEIVDLFRQMPTHSKDAFIRAAVRIHGMGA